jgi:hypothetical protein
MESKARPWSLEVRALTAVIPVLLVIACRAIAITPIARATWSHPNGPGLILGADPREMGLSIGPTDWRPFVSLQGEWKAGRVDAGVRSSIDLLIPVASIGASGSIMKPWEGEALLAGARLWAAQWLFSATFGVYQRFQGDYGDEWEITLGMGIGTP